MARTLAELPAGSRITDYISLGVLAKYFPAEKDPRGFATDQSRQRPRARPTRAY